MYVLGGFEAWKSVLDVMISKGPKGEWRQATEPDGMRGIREFYAPVPAGQYFVSLRFAGEPAYTIASFASPNRATLITLMFDEEGPRIAQYLLPIGHLTDQLDPGVQQMLHNRNQLGDVRTLAQFHRAFRKRRKLATTGGFEEVLWMKWLDPIASCLASYELFRRGDPNHSMPTVVGNMRQFFSDLPDTAALVTLSGQPEAKPTGVPLFFDGLRAFPDYAQWLPLPASHLDFTSPWTAWLAAVK